MNDQRFEIIGYDLTMMSLLADQAGLTERLAFPEGYVIRYYFANLNVMSAGKPVYVTELVRIPASWEYT